MKKETEQKHTHERDSIHPHHQYSWDDRDPDRVRVEAMALIKIVWDDWIELRLDNDGKERLAVVMWRTDKAAQHYNDIDTDIDMDRNNVNGRQTRPPRSHSILTLPLVLVSMNVVVQYSYTYGERLLSQHLHLEQSLWNVMLWHDCQWRIILNCNCTVDGMRHVSCRLLRKLQLQSSWYDLSYCHMIRYPHPLKAFGWNLQTTIVLASTSYWIISHWHPIQSYHIQSNRFLLHTFYIPQYNLTLSFPTNTLSITTTTIHNQQDKN